MECRFENGKKIEMYLFLLDENQQCQYSIQYEKWIAHLSNLMVVN